MGKILVIDDDRTVRALLRMLLRKDGHEVVECSDASCGLKGAVAENPDLILLDLLLPDMNGLQVLSMLKGDEKTKQIPVIVLTSSTDDDSKLTALRRGAVDFISKPFMSEEVHLRTDTQLRLHSLIKSLQEAVSTLENDVVAAGRIQTALVPKSSPEELLMKWIYKPSSKVGGDIFDLMDLGKGKYLLYLADVSGHGVNAAMLSVMVHRFIEDYKTGISNQHRAFSVDDFMKEIEMNFQFEKFNLFFTMAVMVIDTKHLIIDIANAGHPLPLVMTGDDCFFIDGHVEGMIGLGLVEGSHAEFSLNEGDRVYVYTDGITEAKSPEGRCFGSQRLKEGLLKNPGASIEDSIAGVYGELVEFKGSDCFEDDISLIGFELKSNIRERGEGYV